MQSFPPTVIWRHRRENLKKCSLRGLESREDFLFFPYPTPLPIDLTGYIMLTIDAPPLKPEDAGHGLFILDGTWRYAEVMKRQIKDPSLLQYRSLPSHYRTAYPRRQEDCKEPERGLASIEAIYIAYTILNRDTDGLLDLYHWKNQFQHLLRTLTDTVDETKPVSSIEMM